MSAQHRTTKKDIEKKVQRFHVLEALLETHRQCQAEGLPIADPEYIESLKRRVAQAGVRTRNGL